MNNKVLHYAAFLVTAFGNDCAAGGRLPGRVLAPRGFDIETSRRTLCDCDGRVDEMEVSTIQ